MALWVYTTYIAPKLNPEYKDNKEFISDEVVNSETSTATIYAFYTTWCPHCKTNIISEDSGWKKTMAKYNGQKISGVTLTFIEIDGEKAEGDMKDFESTHKISIAAFPTIYLVKGDNVIEFSTDITQDNLTNFLNTAL